MFSAVAWVVPHSIGRCWVLPVFLGVLGGCASDERDLCESLTCVQGAVTRGPVDRKQITLVFTGDEFADGGSHIRRTLNQRSIKGAFFLTGNFYRNPDFKELIEGLLQDGHDLGAHSDQHLLYCAWENRDSLLVTQEEFVTDLSNNYTEMVRFGIDKGSAPFFLPPYEWYNDKISQWTEEWDLTLVNYTPGTLSHADYTTPTITSYRSADTIFESIMSFEEESATGLNGFLLLSHIGVAPERDDKFYLRLDAMIDSLSHRGYEFVPLGQLLEL